jgi:hypothetical protein
MFTRSGCLALALLFALAVTSPSFAEPASSLSLSTSAHAQNVSVQRDSSISPYPNYGGTCVGYDGEEVCQAFAWDASECCSMTIQCPSGSYTWASWFNPSYGWPEYCA